MPKEKIIPEYSGSSSTWNKVYCNSSIKASVNEICHAERKKQYLRRSKNSRFWGGKPHVRKKEKERFIPSVVVKFFLEWLRKLKNIFEKKLSLLAGKCLWKKRSALLNCVLCWSEDIPSLLAGKILHCAVYFFPSKVKYIFCFNTCSRSNP